MDDDKGLPPLSGYVVPASVPTGSLASASVIPTQVPLVVNSANAATVLGKFLPGMPVGTQAVAVIQATGAHSLPLLNGSATSSTAGVTGGKIPGVGPPIFPTTFSFFPDGISYGGPGVIYALSQYSPFISLPRYTGNISLPSPPNLENENSNLGPEDSDGKLSAPLDNVSPSMQDQPICSEPGKCQAGGELRLSVLAESNATIQIPDGFTLVGAKSPMLIGMTLVVAVDKRYLPSEGSSVAMLGFSGNCIGCGATGFRYFTEFSSHINLKLATQPKKQKHLKNYVVKDRDGKWAKGPLIPWKGTETRKRNLPMYSVTTTTYGKTPELLPPYTMSSTKDAMSMLMTTQPLLLQTASFPPAKRAKIEEEVSTTITVTSIVTTSAVEPGNTDATLPLASPKPDPETYLSFKVPISFICGVRPVLLLCQNNTFKLPSNVNDIIISDMLNGCFDLPDTSDYSGASTKSTIIHTGSIMSTGRPRQQTVDNGDPSSHSNVEQSAASTLISMSASQGTNNGNSPGNGIMTSQSQPSKPEMMSAQPNKPEMLPATANTSHPFIDNSGIVSCNLPLSAAIILVIQYLAALDEYNNISREEIESMLQRTRMEMSSSKHNFSLAQIAGSLQLPSLATLLASSSKGKVKVITSSYSFQNGIYKALRWLHDTFNQMKSKKYYVPNFIVILSSPSQGPTEFCVLVTGVSHAKLLAESLGLQGIVHSPLQEDISRLEKQFKQTSDALSILTRAFENKRDGKVYVPFNSYAGVRMADEEAAAFVPKVSPSSPSPSFTKGIFATQLAMAQQLLSQVGNMAENPGILELPSFARVELLIVVPHNISLYFQTVIRVAESGILVDLGLETEECTTDYSLAEKYVLTYSDWPNSVSKWYSFVKKVAKQAHSLFILIFDQAQSYCLPQGMPDVLPDLKEVFEATNVIPVFVTAVPYIFQTRQSFIDPDNEVYWTDARHLQGTTSNLMDDKCIKVNDHDMLYFGIKEFCDSTRWHQQYPLIRHEETFDLAVPRANKLNDVSYHVVHAFILIRLYRAALMVAGGIKPAEPHCVLSAIQMVRDIVEAPLRNADGTGSMLMIRVSEAELGKYCHELLKKTRDSVGLKYRIDVIFDDGQNPIDLDDYFLNRMRIWKMKKGMPQEKAEKWYPLCLEHLLDLPCIVIYSGKDRTGETFPRSLKYCDLHLVDDGSLHRSVVETELGSVACYLSVGPATNSSIGCKPVVMNSVRSSVGTTYLDPAQMSKHLTPDTCHLAGATEDDFKECPACSKEGDLQHEDNSSHFSSKYPLPVVLVSKTIWQLLQSDAGGQPRFINMNSNPNTRWIGSNRPVLVNSNPDHQSRHYRRWTEARPARKVITTPGTSTPPSPSHGESGDQSTVEFNLLTRDGSSTKKQNQNGNVYLSEMGNDDASDEDESDKDQYHPRCLLLSGPPQIGKTGAYLHFSRLLHRMLIRLKKVDVYDNRVSYAPALDPMEVCGIEALQHPQWPDIHKVSETEFITEFLDSEFRNFSRVQICAGRQFKTSCGKQKGQMLKRKSKVTETEGQQIVQVILANCAAHDTLHHCDTCKFYREGIGGNTTKVLDYQLAAFYDDGKVVELQFIIPAMHMKYFIVDEENQAVKSLILPRVSVCSPIPKLIKTEEEASLGRKIKTPILMASCEGEEEGLLNLFHAMEETDYIHVTFVKQSEMAIYQKNWPNHLFAVLPPEFDDASFGAVKQVMKAFAWSNYMVEKQRQSLQEDSQEDVWPLVLMMADNVVMWQQAGKDNEPASESEEEDENLDADALSPSPDTTSLFDTMKLVEATPNVLSYGIIGLRPWSSTQMDVPMHGFIRTFVHSCVFINVKQTSQVTFNTCKYIGENVDFQLRLVENNILTCRFEHLSFMCKVTNRCGWRIPLQPQTWERKAVNPDEDKTPFSHLVVPPDLEDMEVIDAAAHFVMQKYIGFEATSLFPASVGNPEHPVLSIGGYVNLGREITVCVITKNANNELTGVETKSDQIYGGLLLYDYASCVDKEFLSQFKFTKDARLCIVCNDRYSMREEVERLDLEEHWRFKFRDEYQTATSTEGEKKPVFFLTG